MMSSAFGAMLAARQAHKYPHRRAPKYSEIKNRIRQDGCKVYIPRDISKVRPICALVRLGRRHSRCAGIEQAAPKIIKQSVETSFGNRRGNGKEPAVLSL